MVVEDYYSGSCHIKINDEYCKDVSPEQIAVVAKRIGQIYRDSQVRKEVNVQEM